MYSHGIKCGARAATVWHAQIDLTTSGWCSTLIGELTKHICKLSMLLLILAFQPSVASCMGTTTESTTVSPS
jgi:hypothetical protein